MTGDRQRLSRTFDRVAQLYDEVRPGYPEALFDDLVALSALPDRGCILEVGCGTGQATAPLARRGYRILALEPGANLAAVSRRNLAAFSEVEVRERSFEEWELEARPFDLVVAATSFKWVDPAIRYWKAGEALRSGGCAALFWNAHVYVPEEDRFFDDVQAIYRRYLPDSVGRPSLGSELPTTIDQGFAESGMFEQVAVRQYPWTEWYDTGRYIKLLQTFSEHIALPEKERASLLREVAALIDSGFGGRLVKHQVAVLQLARRLPAV